MITSDDTAVIQRSIDNTVDFSALGEKSMAAVIGDAPSHYSKSPALWNTAFGLLGVNAAYLPFDVTQANLPKLVTALRQSERFLGGNITVSHKIGIMSLLDEVDQKARRIGAVNTIVRTAAGTLTGHNTDGDGFIQSLLMTLPGQTQPFLPTLAAVDVLLLGAGGAAHAVASGLADRLLGGRLLVCNRTREHAVSLAEQLCTWGCNAAAVDESEIPHWAPKVDLIINCTTKGQGSVRRLADGRLFTLEPYSSLAPAHPEAIDPREFDETAGAEPWPGCPQSDIDANNTASLALAEEVPDHVRFYDLIYHPDESVFLRHGRMTGHRTSNGKAMIVCQAAIALCAYVCKHLLPAAEVDAATEQAVREIMFAHW